MNPTPTAREIFIELLNQVPPAQWDERLDEVAGSDSALRHRVRALLAAHADPGSFLQRPVMEGLAPAFDVNSDKELHGAVIDRYTLIEPIGEGGFGVVYLAEQKEPLKRQVALKVIKPGMDSMQVIARFEAERQALALMDHPNIAKVLDGGTTLAGRPYFVMELVKGVPITDYCDRCQLTIRERLELFADVCRAVQHAHQKGVIHRDLKPSNILVAMTDGEHAPKVIDFGVAKAIGKKLTTHTLHTGFSQMIGTPAYMSPEQAELRPIDVDTRADVYSLGVLLYELLTGTTPLSKERFIEASFDELRRIIREEDPPRPSTRVSTLAAGEATTIIECRRLDSRQFAQQLRGELDWIVLLALEKDRRRRYESPGVLAADIQRYLDNEPVLACPPSRAYHVKKLLSRHRGLAAAVCAIITALSIGLVIATYAFFLADKRRVSAERASSQAQTIAQALNEMLESADPSKGNASDYTVRAMLDEFADTLDGQLNDDPQVECTLRHTIGRAYFHLGLPRTSEPHLRRALALCEGDSQLPEARILTDLAELLIHSFIELGPAASANGGAPSTNVLADPENLVRKAIKIYRNRGKTGPELANSLCVLGWILYHRSGGVGTNTDNKGEAETALREGIAIVENRTDKRSQIVKGRLFVHLAFTLWRRGAKEEARAVAKDSLRLLRDNSPHDRHMRWALLANGIRNLRERPSEAEFNLREAIRFEEHMIGSVQYETLHLLMTAMFSQGRISEAFDVARDTAIDPRATSHPTFGRTRKVVGYHYLGLGDFENAERQSRIAVEHGMSHFDHIHSATIDARLQLAQALTSQDDSEKQIRAQEIFARLLPIAREGSQTDDEPYIYSYTYIVGSLESPSSEDVKRALEVNRRVREQRLSSVHRLRNLYAGALVQNQAGNAEEAKALLQEVLEMPSSYGWWGMGADPAYFILRNAEDDLTRMLLSSANEVEAEQVYRDAITRRGLDTRPDQFQIVFAKHRLARFLLAQGKSEEARELLVAVQASLASAPDCLEWLKKRTQQDIASAEEQLE